MPRKKPLFLFYFGKDIRVSFDDASFVVEFPDDDTLYCASISELCLIAMKRDFSKFLRKSDIDGLAKLSDALKKAELSVIESLKSVIPQNLDKLSGVIYGKK